MTVAAANGCSCSSVGPPLGLRREGSGGWQTARSCIPAIFHIGVCVFFWMAYYSRLIVHLRALHNRGAQKNMDLNDTRLVLVQHLMGRLCNFRSGVCIHTEHDGPLDNHCRCASNPAHLQLSESRLYGEFTYLLSALRYRPVPAAQILINTVIKEWTCFS